MRFQDTGERSVLLLLEHVLHLTRDTAQRVRTIEARQSLILRRVDRIERDEPPRKASPVRLIGRIGLALSTVVGTALANLNAESIAHALAALGQGLLATLRASL